MKLDVVARIDRIEETSDGRLKVALVDGANWYFVLPERKTAVETDLRRAQADGAELRLHYAVPGNVIHTVTAT